MPLSAERVFEIGRASHFEKVTPALQESIESGFRRCLRGEEPKWPEEVAFGAGIVHQHFFSRELIQPFRDEVKELLGELPIEPGIPVPFQSLCYDRSGNQWGEHIDMEVLCALGVALDLAEWVRGEPGQDIAPGLSVVRGMPWFMLKEKTP